MSNDMFKNEFHFPAAILAYSRSELFDCEIAPYVSLCVVAGLRTIMVILSALRDEISEDALKIGTFEETVQHFNHPESQVMHPIDFLTIATKGDPQLMKDVPLDYVESLGLKCRYLGENPIIQTLRDNKITMKSKNKEYWISRWAKVDVDQAARSTDLDDIRQHHCFHRESK